MMITRWMIKMLSRAYEFLDERAKMVGYVHTFLRRIAYNELEWYMFPLPHERFGKDCQITSKC